MVFWCHLHSLSSLWHIPHARIRWMDILNWFLLMWWHEFTTTTENWRLFSLQFWLLNGKTWWIAMCTDAYIWHYSTVYNVLKQNMCIIIIIAMYNVIMYNCKAWAWLLLQNCKASTGTDPVYSDSSLPDSGTFFITFTPNSEASEFIKFCVIKINTLIRFWMLIYFASQKAAHCCWWIAGLLRNAEVVMSEAMLPSSGRYG